MKRYPPKTQAELRRANRGNVPGVLGMAEMAMLMGQPHCRVDPSAQKPCVHAASCRCEGCTQSQPCPECMSPFAGSHFGDCRIANGMKPDPRTKP